MSDPTPTPWLTAILRAIEERLTRLEDAVQARSAPASEVRQALDDILNIYNVTGQTGSVIIQQRDQIQALAEAMTIFHARLLKHDQQSSDERAEIHSLMVQIRSLARKQVAQLDTLEAASGMTAEERAAVRDVQATAITDQALQALTLLGQAAEEAREEIKDAAEAAREVIKEEKQAEG
jgi:hypothetical protein